jgi:hypothetical protein
VALDFQTFNFCTTHTFVHYKLSPLIRLSYAKFRLQHTGDEQIFCAITQWHCKIESLMVFCVH